MCTVSVISVPPAHAETSLAGLRVVVNRDEQRDRPLALAPRWRSTGSRMVGDDRRAIWPTDPKGGGTWVAASDRGLVLAILNLNLEPMPPLPAGDSLTSRGLLIPKLIWLPDADAVAEELSEMALERFAPFRLVMGQPATTGNVSGQPVVMEARWDRERLTVTCLNDGPACFVSSGLGDSKAAPRLPLFDDLVIRQPSAQSQDAFHHHVWPDRPEVSVLMSRRAARTVSITTVDIIPALDAAGTVPLWSVRMGYRPIFAPEAEGSVSQNRLAGG